MAGRGVMGAKDAMDATDGWTGGMGVMERWRGGRSIGVPHRPPTSPCRCARAQATEALRITAPELVGYGVMDTVVPEPLGGAHADPVGAFPYIKQTLLDTYEP